MYPILCRGGYAIPIKAGKFKVFGVMATVDDTTASSQIALVDDPAIGDNLQGFVLSDVDETKNVIANVKGVGSVDGTIGIMLPEPIFVRHGLSAYFTNVVPGSICVYA